MAADNRVMRIVVVAGLSLWFLLSGCHSQAVSPDPVADAVAAARAGTTERVEMVLAEVSRGLRGDELGHSQVDQCYEGQRNYKVDTGYEHRCSLLLGVLVGLDGDFRARMLELDGWLQQSGWQSRDGEWPGALVDAYWDLHRGESPDGRVRIHHLPAPNDLRRDDLRMLLDYGDPNELSRIDRAQQETLWCCGVPYHEDEVTFEVNQLAGDTAYEHYVFISVEAHYFQN